jgi:hypothetical protein
MVNRGMILPSPHDPATLCLSECAIVNRENSYPISPDPPIRLEAPVIHAGEEKRTSGFSRLHPHG